jgi:hypothetical protein
MRLLRPPGGATVFTNLKSNIFALADRSKTPLYSGIDYTDVIIENNTPSYINAQLIHD